MKALYIALLLVSSGILTQAALAQRWEVGGGVGGSFFTSQNVKNGPASGDVGLSKGVVGSFWLANNSSHLLGGELRYDYQHTNLTLSSAGASTSFEADSHAIHYDFLLHFAPKDSKVRPYVSGGAGIKLFRGLGKENASQPLSSLALLTKTTETKGLVSVGAGVKFALASTMQLRLEIRDELTPFPTHVIAPAQGAKINGWLQDFVALVGISTTF